VGESAADSILDPKQVRGVKPLRKLLPLLASLRGVGCGRDAAGNRELHFDQYVTLVLLYLFNPLIDSVRSLQQAAAIEKVSRQLGVKRFSLGSFSESARVFEPARLKQVVDQLRGRLDALNPVGRDPRLKDLGDLGHVLTAADGTVLDAIAKVARAWWLPLQNGTSKYAWKLHVNFDVEHDFPVDLELTDARNSGDSDERNVLAKKLRPGHCYVMDRLYLRYTLLNQIHATASSYVCRVREQSAFEVVEERPLPDGARAAGVVRDAVVRMGMGCKPGARPDHPMRVIVIEATPHERRGGRRGKTAGPGNKGAVVIVTDLLHVPADVVALIYRHRYAVEIFFRFLKQVLGCRHLISNKPEGVMVQMYCAVIACLVINLWTGRKPTKRTVEMLAMYFIGVATEREVLEHLSRPDNTGVKLRAKEALWEKLGY
jgi:Transposase DDE domain